MPRQLTLPLRRIFTGALDVYQSLCGFVRELGKEFVQTVTYSFVRIIPPEISGCQQENR